jgi:uncharacterized membrane protein YfbV (UPF0208 family)
MTSGKCCLEGCWPQAASRTKWQSAYSRTAPPREGKSKSRACHRLPRSSAPLALQSLWRRTNPSISETNPSSEEFVHEVARKFAAIGKQLEAVESTVSFVHHQGVVSQAEERVVGNRATSTRSTLTDVRAQI